MVEWGRSEDGHVDSKCGRWRIVPRYSSCVRPQWYDLIDSATGKKYRMFTTQSWAKVRAEEAARCRE